MWEVEELGGDVRLDVVERIDEARNDNDVLEDVPGRLEGRTLEAVGAEDKRRGRTLRSMQYQV